MVGLPAFWRAHLYRLSRAQDLPEVGSGPLVVCSLILSALSLCSWCVVFEYGSISRFKGVFSEVWGVCVGLCGSGALRGLWGLCTRVELGGFRACGVFASIFPLLCLHFIRFSSSLPSFSSLYLLSCFACPLCLPCLFVLSLWLFGCGCCFLFPCGLYAKRKGAPCWCVLSSCVVSVQILVTLSKNSVAVALAFSSSFG